MPSTTEEQYELYKAFIDDIKRRNEQSSVRANGAKVCKLMAKLLSLNITDKELKSSHPPKPVVGSWRQLMLSSGHWDSASLNTLLDASILSEPPFNTPVKVAGEGVVPRQVTGSVKPPSGSPLTLNPVTQSSLQETNTAYLIKHNRIAEPPSCACVEKSNNENIEGPYYIHLGAANSIKAIREIMEERTGLYGEAVRIEKVRYTTKEGRTSQGCPAAKWILRRASVDEKVLVVTKHRPGHYCATAWIIIAIALWEGVPEQAANHMYDYLTRTLPVYGYETERRCGTNQPRDCACQGWDTNRKGASFSFGCSWSVYYNACKFARSHTPRKFRMRDQSFEGVMESKFQALGQHLAPLYKQMAPMSYGAQVRYEGRAGDCRIGFRTGRPFSGCTATVDFCAHQHKDNRNVNNGCTVVVTLTKHRGLSKPDDEQLHALPMYCLDDTDEHESTLGIQKRIANGSIEVLNSFSQEQRHRSRPYQKCKKGTEKYQNPKVMEAYMESIKETLSSDTKGASSSQIPAVHPLCGGDKQHTASLSVTLPATQHQVPQQVTQQVPQHMQSIKLEEYTAPLPSSLPPTSSNSTSTISLPSSSATATSGESQVPADSAQTTTVHAATDIDENDEGLKPPKPRPPSPEFDDPEGMDIHQENEHLFKDPNVGGVAFALQHGTVLFEVAKRELHATTALKQPDRYNPTRISLVFYQHKKLNYAKHGFQEYRKAEEVRQRVRKAAGDAAVDDMPKDSEKKVGRKQKKQIAFATLKFLWPHPVNHPIASSSTTIITTWVKPQCIMTGSYEKWTLQGNSSTCPTPETEVVRDYSPPPSPIIVPLAIPYSSSTKSGTCLVSSVNITLTTMSTQSTQVVARTVTSLTVDKERKQSVKYAIVSSLSCDPSSNKARSSITTSSSANLTRFADSTLQSRNDSLINRIPPLNLLKANFGEDFARCKPVSMYSTSASMTTTMVSMTTTTVSLTNAAVSKAGKFVLVSTTSRPISTASRHVSMTTAPVAMATVSKLVSTAGNKVNITSAAAFRAPMTSRVMSVVKTSGSLAISSPPMTSTCVSMSSTIVSMTSKCTAIAPASLTRELVPITSNSICTGSTPASLFSEPASVANNNISMIRKSASTASTPASKTSALVFVDTKSVSAARSPTSMSSTSVSMTSKPISTVSTRPAPVTHDLVSPTGRSAPMTSKSVSIVKSAPMVCESAPIASRPISIDSAPASVLTTRKSVSLASMSVPMTHGLVSMDSMPSSMNSTPTTVDSTHTFVISEPARIANNHISMIRKLTSTSAPMASKLVSVAKNFVSTAGKPSLMVSKPTLKVKTFVSSLTDVSCASTSRQPLSLISDMEPDVLEADCKPTDTTRGRMNVAGSRCNNVTISSLQPARKKFKSDLSQCDSVTCLSEGKLAVKKCALQKSSLSSSPKENSAGRAPISIKQHASCKKMALPFGSRSQQLSCHGTSSVGNLTFDSQQTSFKPRITNLQTMSTNSQTVSQARRTASTASVHNLQTTILQNQIAQKAKLNSVSVCAKSANSTSNFSTPTPRIANTIDHEKSAPSNDHTASIEFSTGTYISEHNVSNSQTKQTRVTKLSIIATSSASGTNITGDAQQSCSFGKVTSQTNIILPFTPKVATISNENLKPGEPVFSKVSVSSPGLMPLPSTGMFRCTSAPHQVDLLANKIDPSILHPGTNTHSLSMIRDDLANSYDLNSSNVTTVTPIHPQQLPSMFGPAVATEYSNLDGNAHLGPANQDSYANGVNRNATLSNVVPISGVVGNIPPFGFWQHPVIQHPQFVGNLMPYPLPEQYMPAYNPITFPFYDLQNCPTAGSSLCPPTMRNYDVSNGTASFYPRP